MSTLGAKMLNMYPTQHVMAPDIVTILHPNLLTIMLANKPIEMYKR
jgi:hypothetical protein